MTLQQLEYLIAIDKSRNFTLAAEACGVTQPTLSAMVQKLETEFDVIIFDRSKQPINVTPIGRKIIDQAYIALNTCHGVSEIVKAEKYGEHGAMHMGILPTITPYIVPKYLAKIRACHPQFDLQISELQTSAIIAKLHCTELDVALLATPLNRTDLLEIPLYYEKFIAYISPTESIHKQLKIESSKMPTDKMWILQEGHCLRGQILNICNPSEALSKVYQGGSIDTLINIVDENGGYTIIPELHSELLSEQQQKNLRELVEPSVVREISLVVRRDFVKERALNILAEAIKAIVPESMINPRLKKFAIHL
ncbi:MAG: LysR substrate-binding domain-containing protein [Bacteroidales bacterium]